MIFRFSYFAISGSVHPAGPPQFAGLGGAVEIGGESQLGSLIPYNVDSQDVRQRFWDGHDYFFNDNVSWLKKNHLIQFGGSYQRNFDFHGATTTAWVSIRRPFTRFTAIRESTTALILCRRGCPPVRSFVAAMYAEVLGIVGQTQVMYSRSGANLQLNPLELLVSTRACFPCTTSTLTIRGT